MPKFNFNKSVSFEATGVGDLINDELSARGMGWGELSELTGINISIIDDIIKDNRSITPEMAVLLETALGISAPFLLRIQSQYKSDCAKLSIK